MVLASATSNSKKRLTLSQTIASAGLAGCTADLVTFPLDTVKVWLQVRGEGFACSHSSTAPLAKRQAAKPSRRQTIVSDRTVTKIATTPANMQKQTNVVKSALRNESLSTNRSTWSTKFSFLSNNKAQKSTIHVIKPIKTDSKSTSIMPAPTKASTSQNIGLFKTITQGVRSNGFFSLYGGISAGLQRQVAFCAVRVGLYDSVKGLYHNLLPESRGGKHLGQRILAGVTTAFVAVGCFQPTEVVKIRMQAQTTKSAETRLYSSCFQAYRSIFKVGLSEAWKGVETNAARLAVVNVCELVTYDVFKELLLEHRLMKDNPACHFTSAFLSGLVTTVIASPVDVIKTRYMNSSPNQYRSPLACAKQMLFNEGFSAFYKGFVPAYLRLGTWNVVMFVSYEQYKSFFYRYNKRQNDMALKQIFL